MRRLLFIFFVCTEIILAKSKDNLSRNKLVDNEQLSHRPGNIFEVEDAPALADMNHRPREAKPEEILNELAKNPTNPKEIQFAAPIVSRMPPPTSHPIYINDHSSDEGSDQPRKEEPKPSQKPTPTSQSRGSGPTASPKTTKKKYDSDDSHDVYTESKTVTIFPTLLRPNMRGGAHCGGRAASTILGVLLAVGAIALL